MKTRKFVTSIAVGSALAVVSVASIAATPKPNPNVMYVTAALLGTQNLPPVDVPATGAITADTTDTSFKYNLSMSNLSSAVTKVHIHFAQAFTNGGLMVNLCGAQNNPCPATTGGKFFLGSTVSAGDANALPGIAMQGIRAGDLGQLLKAIRDGNAYVNIHTANFDSEARGQLAKTNRPPRIK